MKDMREALKRMDGAKINGRRIIVDVERGRTVQDWKPRRLGGGRGDTRKSRQKSNPVMSAIVIRVECTREVDTETIVVKIDTEMIEEGTIEEEETIEEIDTETIEGEIDVIGDTAAAAAEEKISIQIQRKEGYRRSGGYRR